MRKFALAAAVAAAALLAAPTAAHAEWYAGAAYTQYEPDDADANGGLTARLGYRMNQNFAVEGEGTFGVDDDDDSELNSAVGLYGVGILPIGASGFEVHGRAGYNQLDIDRDFAPDITDGGLSYGVGVGWNARPGLGLRADFTRTETDDGDADAISLGGTINF